jgi:hypothetical protein
MLPLADNLSLTAGYDEETLFILAFLNKQFVDIYLLGFERTSQSVQYLVIKLRKQRY